MMRQYELVELVAEYIDQPNEVLLNQAYVYAMQKHGEQKRASGDPYFSHPLEVAAILTRLRLDEETIAVALLHDTIEDTDATRREIDELFGERIGKLVEGLTKLKRLDLVSQQAKQAENLRRLLLAISDDIRVLLVKLADRLHNMRTLGIMRPEKSKRIATETMEIYAPLAGRMGMQDLRDELEELSFKYINPEAYQAVIQHLQDLADKNRTLTEEISETLLSNFKERKIDAVVKSRQKKPYSVFRKMESKSLSFEQLSDIFGFRIIVPNIEDCYRALGLVHTDWKMVPGRFKDFISVPKQNDYQSIHTTVFGPSNQRVELQIRTQAMNSVAEYGIAAHSGYKDGEDYLSGSKAYLSLRKTIEQLAQGDNPEEFLEHTKLELFLDQVFCFTPKGKIIALPTGATPIDFAYAVHTDIGNSTIGCKLNGKIMPVITKLSNGDEVQIIRSESQTPPAAWESVAVTGKAKSSIRRASRKSIQRQYSALGAGMLERAFSEAGFKFNPDELSHALARLARNTVEDVLTDVGRGEIRPVAVIKAVHDNFELNNTDTASSAKQLLPLVDLPKGQRASKIDHSEIPVRGIQADVPVRFSEPGGAVPGDEIVGILTQDEGVVIYPSCSTRLANYNGPKDNLLDLRWDLDPKNPKRFPAKLKVMAKNQPGTLAVIATVIAADDGNIHNISLQVPVEEFSEMEIDVDVWDLAHLSNIISQIKNKSVTISVERITD